MQPTVQIILAIMSIAISILLGIIAWLTYRRDKKVKISEIHTAITQQCNTVNSGIGQYGIGGPYTTLLGIPQAQYQQFGYYAVVLFHQLNLLNMVYKYGVAPNSNLLSKTDVDGYESWIKTVFKPWVDSNAYLRQLLNAVLAQEDIYGRKFLEWLRDLMK